MDTRYHGGRHELDKQAKVRLILVLNPQQAILIDRLIDTGLYGRSRSQAAMVLINGQLSEIFGEHRPQH